MSLPETRLLNECHEHGWDIRNAIIDGVGVHANSRPDGGRHRVRFNFAGQAHDLVIDRPVNELTLEAFAHIVRERRAS